MLNTNYSKCDKKTIELYDPTYSQKYRDYDNEYLNTPDYLHYSTLLSDISMSFNRPIKVLEVGCGTGRYFHTLKNTVELTGIDISESMLKLAERPLMVDQVNIPLINLVQGSVFEHDFGDQKFDFIYSIGVLGEHAPFTGDICNKLFDLLSDDGCAFFTIVDIDDRKNLKRKLAERAYPILPGSIKHLLDQRWETNYMTRKELDKMMTESKFDDHSIGVYKAEGGGWSGAHMECIANKYDTIARSFFV